MHNSFGAFILAAGYTAVYAFPTLVSERDLYNAAIVDHSQARSLAKRADGGALPDDFDNHPYVPQQPGQDRSPCPALNTLANHGYLPREGKDISRSDLSQAFEAGWGIGQSVIENATENAFSTCELVHGDGSCPTTFDLSDLNEPDAFEHDHSLSRQDYNELYAVTSDGYYLPVDNHDFNRTIFGSSLQVLDGTDTMSVPQAQQVRLQREHLAYISDPRDTFKENRFTQETELGFIFAVMRNFNTTRNNVAIQSPNDLSDQTVMVDWWSFWFSRQEFPVELGWRKPVENVEFEYVAGIRSSVASVTPTSTPSPLPPDALMQPTEIPVRQTPTPGKRDVTTTTAAGIGLPTLTTVLPGLVSHILTFAESVYEEASSLIGPTPTPLAPYDTSYAAADFRSYKSALSSYASELDDVVVSLLEGKTPNPARAEAMPTPA